MSNVRQFRLGLLPLLLTGAFGLVSAACSQSSGGGGGGNGSGSGGSPGGNGCFDYSGFDLTSPAVQFQADVLPIFRQSCGLSMSCHGSETPPLPAEHFLGPSIMDPAPTAMQIEEIIGGIVGQKSVDNPDMDIIATGDPAQSFMLYKLDGDPTNLNGLTCPTLTCAANMTCLLSMPSGGPSLPDTERNTIRRWVAQGAKND
jgi:hypothetical protein